MNDAGGQVGVTLLVGGTWITGTLIPPRMFMEESAAHFAEHGGPGGEGLRAFFREIGRRAFPSESEADAGLAPEPKPDEGPYHLHLRNGRAIFAAAYMLPSDGCYLRVRLTEVGAWFIGDLGPTGYRIPEPPIPPG
jgi:hypothetical protein